MFWPPPQTTTIEPARPYTTWLQPSPHICIHCNNYHRCHHHTHMQRCTYTCTGIHAHTCTYTQEHIHTCKHPYTRRHEVNTTCFMAIPWSMWCWPYRNLVGLLWTQANDTVFHPEAFLCWPWIRSWRKTCNTVVTLETVVIDPLIKHQIMWHAMSQYSVSNLIGSANILAMSTSTCWKSSDVPFRPYCIIKHLPCETNLYVGATGAVGYCLVCWQSVFCHRKFPLMSMCRQDTVQQFLWLISNVSSAQGVKQSIQTHLFAKLDGRLLLFSLSLKDVGQDVGL